MDSTLGGVMLGLAAGLFGVHISVILHQAKLKRYNKAFMEMASELELARFLQNQTQQRLDETSEMADRLAKSVQELSYYCDEKLPDASKPKTLLSEFDIVSKRNAALCTKLDIYNF